MSQNLMKIKKERREFNIKIIVNARKEELNICGQVYRTIPRSTSEHKAFFFRLARSQREQQQNNRQPRRECEHVCGLPICWAPTKDNSNYAPHFAGRRVELKRTKELVESSCTSRNCSACTPLRSH
jgi:hypothetical protein